VFVSMVVLTMVSWINVDKSHCKNGIKTASKDNMADMIFAIFEENKGNVRVRGFKDDDIIETYEQSMEAMALNEGWNKKHDFKDVLSAMANIKKSKGEKNRGNRKGRGKPVAEEKVEEPKEEQKDEAAP